MKSIYLYGMLFLSVLSSYSQVNQSEKLDQPLIAAPKPTNYSIAFGVNVLVDKGESRLPINAVYSFKTPFFLTVERRFKSKLSMALTLSTNRLEIAAVEKGYFSIDAVGQFYFNDYLFKSKKIEMYAGLGLGRFFMENNGNNTFNLTGGARYWFSNHYGVSFQGFGKVGLAPINTSVYNHYQYNLGIVWRFNQDKGKLVNDSKSEEIIKGESIPEKEILGNTTEKEIAPLLSDTKSTILHEPQIVSKKITEETSKEQTSTTAIETVKKDLPVVIQTKTNDYKIGDDLEKSFNIKMIYFAAGKFNITNQASKELEKIVVVMNQYPTLKIAILSHTDCSKSVKYNLVLSEKRAKATLNWLVNRGINKSRLTSKGYGQSRLLNSCDCITIKKSGCTEVQHQENRRSEFIITSL